MEGGRKIKERRLDKSLEKTKEEDINIVIRKEQREKRTGRRNEHREKKEAQIV